MVEKFMSYSEDVGSLQDAYAFIWDYVDQFSAPSISIDAYTSYSGILDILDESAPGEVRWGVRVSGVLGEESPPDDVN